MNLKRFLKNPYRIFSILAIKGLFNWLPDETFIKLQFRAQMGMWPNLENPTTFNEKLQWLKLHDRKPEYTQMVDKHEVRNYIANAIGEEYLIPLVGGPWSSFEEIDFEKLPDRFVLKCTHDSGGLVICRDKNRLDIVAAKKKIEASLKRDYYLSNREWPYKNVKPQIIAEQYMDGGNQSGSLSDYKIHCFNGKAKMILVCQDRFETSGLTEDFFTEKWEHMDVCRPEHPNAQSMPARPEELEQMLLLAEKLAEGLPFIRVDFYAIKGKIYFGELTFYPASGITPFVPHKWDHTLGEWIKLQ